VENGFGDEDGEEDAEEQAEEDDVLPLIGEPSNVKSSFGERFGLTGREYASGTSISSPSSSEMVVMVVVVDSPPNCLRLFAVVWMDIGPGAGWA